MALNTVLLLEMKTAFSSIASLLLVACTTPLPTYTYTTSSNDDPQIEFKSDFVLHTKFGINVADTVANRCADYQSVGYILKKDSIFIYDKPNAEIKIHTPRDNPVIVVSTHHFDGGDYRSSCGPLRRKFIARAGISYTVNLAKLGSVCRLNVSAKTSDGNDVPLVAEPISNCQRD